MRSDRREKKASAFETTRQGEVGSETRKTRRNARVQVHVLLGRERVFALLLLEDAAELHDALLLVRERGGRSDRAREGAASDPRRVTFARKTGAERRAAEGTAGVSEGPAGTCLHEVPSLLQVDDLAVVHDPGRTRVAVALRRSRVGTLAQSLRDLRLGRGDVVARYALSREPGAPNDGDAEHSGRAPNQRAATTRALLHSGAGEEGATSNEARENTRNTDSGTRLSRQSPKSDRDSSPPT
jgi:hypothetical protein